MWKSLNICTTNSIGHTYSTKLSNSVLQYFKLHFACVLQVLDNVGVTQRNTRCVDPSTRYVHMCVKECACRRVCVCVRTCVCVWSCMCTTNLNHWEQTSNLYMWEHFQSTQFLHDTAWTHSLPAACTLGCRYRQQWTQRWCPYGPHHHWQEGAALYSEMLSVYKNEEKEVSTCQLQCIHTCIIY